IGKLVRDRIPEIIQAEGRSAAVRVLDDREYLAALRAKLGEEVGELLDADPGDWLDEAADVLEVLVALLGLQGAGLQQLLDARDAKRRHRGAFEKRYWWEPS